MERTNFLIPLAVLVFILVVFAPREEKIENKPFKYSYQNGDLLFPDYTCEDTLYVINAKALNSEMTKIRNTGWNDASDELIDDVFYKYCAVWSSHYCKYTHCPFKQGTPYFQEGCGDCFPNDDCWKLDSIHFYHPKLDYDGCDSIFSLLK